MDNRPREDEQGQVSEVSGLDEAGMRSPSDAVAGHPTDDEVQEGATGPDARTGDQDQHEHLEER
ncbi:hypothetical protein FHP29_05880 [Nocardioides albidus]|uniref:Uncharacterized protein n=1 Tax=Nocardioides albidus TaxID=1517589 RepID=A0A5C4W7S9_9ACTN|nr:hypothetical protein [Nocardioides albidus]TNM44230.1 hypothetical protein FHP29_05880 [Nocardioides albidus]